MSGPTKVDKIYKKLENEINLIIKKKANKSSRFSYNFPLDFSTENKLTGNEMLRLIVHGGSRKKIAAILAQ